MTSHQVVRDYRVLLRHLSKLPSKNILKNELQNQFQRGAFHALTHSLIHLLTRSLTYSLTHLLTHSLTYSLTYSLTHSGKIEKNKEKIILMRHNAYNYAKNVAAVNELRYLRSLDTGEKLTPQEIVRRTAAKVGFALPIEYKGE